MTKHSTALDDQRNRRDVRKSKTIKGRKLFFFFLRGEVGLPFSSLLLRVPWTARRSNWSILKEINPEYSLEGLMLKLQYFDHLM